MMDMFLNGLMAGDAAAIAQAAAGYFVLMGLWGVIHMYRVSRWPSVTGTVLSQGLKGGDMAVDDETLFRLKVLYRYVVDGRVYENDQINSLHIGLSYNLRHLLRWQLRFVDWQDDDRVRVYHHPSKPQKSYLVVPGWRQLSFASVLCFGAAALILLGS